MHAFKWILISVVLNLACTQQSQKTASNPELELDTKLFNIEPESAINLNCGTTLACLHSRLAVAMKSENFAELAVLDKELTDRFAKYGDAKTGVLLSQLHNNRHEFQKALDALEPFQTGEATYQKSINHLNLGHYDQAKKYLNLLIAEHPSAKLYYVDALIYAGQNNAQMAEKSFEKSLSLEDVDDYSVGLKTRIHYAKFLLEHGQVARAELISKDLSKHNSEKIEVAALNGLVKTYQGQYAEALPYFQKSAEVTGDPKYMIPVAVLSKTLGDNKTFDQSLDKAAAIVREEIANGASAHKFELAKILTLKGTPESLAESKSLIEEVKTHYTNYAITVFHALTLHKLGNSEQAESEVTVFNTTGNENLNALANMIHAENKNLNPVVRAIAKIKGTFSDWDARFITMQI